MPQRLVIIGAGFAGIHAALASARLRDANGVSSKDLEIALVAPEPTLVVRPRLYEPDPDTLTSPPGALLEAIDVRSVPGRVETIHTANGSRGIHADAGKSLGPGYLCFIPAAVRHLLSTPASGPP